MSLSAAVSRSRDFQGETGESGDGDERATSSLLLQLDAEAWEVIARKARISGESESGAGGIVGRGKHRCARARSPALPISWQTAMRKRASAQPTTCWKS